MKIHTLAMAGSLALLCSCAGTQNSLDRSMAQAESSRELAQEMKLDEASTANAAAKLDEAKTMKEQGEEEQAAILADESNLEYRLAMATAERDAVKKEDARVESELRSDVERKLLYQGILDKELSKDATHGGNK